MGEKIKLDDLKRGYLFREGEIVDIEDIGKGFIRFETYQEIPKGIKLIEYCGRSKDGFLEHIFTTGENAVKLYEWGAKCPWPRLS